MDLRERTARWNRHNANGPASGPGSDPGLGSARQDTRELMRAGREAIERALSGDSPAFLAASIQASGQ